MTQIFSLWRLDNTLRILETDEIDLNHGNRFEKLRILSTQGSLKLFGLLGDYIRKVIENVKLFWWVELSLIPRAICLPLITKKMRLYQLIRHDTGRPANEVFTSNPIVSSKQYLERFKNYRFFWNSSVLYMLSAR